MCVCASEIAHIVIHITDRDVRAFVWCGVYRAVKISIRMVKILRACECEMKCLNVCLMRSARVNSRTHRIHPQERNLKWVAQNRFSTLAGRSKFNCTPSEGPTSCELRPYTPNICAPSSGCGVLHSLVFTIIITSNLNEMRMRERTALTGFDCGRSIKPVFGWILRRRACICNCGLVCIDGERLPKSASSRIFFGACYHLNKLGSDVSR